MTPLQAIILELNRANFKNSLDDRCRLSMCGYTCLWRHDSRQCKPESLKKITMDSTGALAACSQVSIGNSLGGLFQDDE